MSEKGPDDTQMAIIAFVLIAFICYLLIGITVLLGLFRPVADCAYRYNLEDVET